MGEGINDIVVRACLSTNFGDNLNSELVRLISGQTPKLVNNRFGNLEKETIYMAIGSVLGWATEETEVWG
ncbi:MAG: hypothetical protein M0R03_13165, partial [Novosphingobium sp.]|nr:hypothetical protein [Novosphingobium sp.]